jgi:hypothetical protein
MIPQAEEGTKENEDLKDVKLVLRHKVTAEDVFDQANKHSGSLQDHQTHCNGISDGVSLRFGNDEDFGPTVDSQWDHSPPIGVPNVELHAG